MQYQCTCLEALSRSIVAACKPTTSKPRGNYVATSYVATSRLTKRALDAKEALGKTMSQP